MHAYLQHVSDAIACIREYTADMTLDTFLASTMTQDAVLRNLENIGEACRNSLRHHEDFALEHASVPWRSPYEMRNALAHGYFDIDLVTVWQTIQSDLPSFDAQIRALPWPSPPITEQPT